MKALGLMVAAEEKSRLPPQITCIVGQSQEANLEAQSEDQGLQTRRGQKGKAIPLPDKQ